MNEKKIEPIKSAKPAGQPHSAHTEKKPVTTGKPADKAKPHGTKPK